MPVPGMFDAPMYHSTRGRSFDDSETYYGNNKQTGKVRGLPDNNALKTFAPDKEKASNVAKIKVVVCFPNFRLFFFSHNILPGD